MYFATLFCNSFTTVDLSLYLVSCILSDNNCPFGTGTHTNSFLFGSAITYPSATVPSTCVNPSGMYGSSAVLSFILFIVIYFSANLPFLAYVLNVNSPFLVTVYSILSPGFSFPSGSVIVFIPSLSSTVAVAVIFTLV